MYLVITNVMMKTCLNQKIMKISNFIQAVGKYSDKIGFRKNSAFGYLSLSDISESESYPKAEFFRKPILSEYLPNVRKCALNSRHDNREVTLSANFAL